LALLVLFILWFIGGGSIVMDIVSKQRQLDAAEERLERLRAR
jgi:cell division protein FtsB